MGPRDRPERLIGCRLCPDLHSGTGARTSLRQGGVPERRLGGGMIGSLGGGPRDNAVAAALRKGVREREGGGRGSGLVVGMLSSEGLPRQHSAAGAPFCSRGSLGLLLPSLRIQSCSPPRSCVPSAPREAISSGIGPLIGSGCQRGPSQAASAGVWRPRSPTPTRLPSRSRRSALARERG